MLTDRDIVVRVLAEGKDPANTKAQHEVERVPVIDGQQLVGVVSEADVAGHATPGQLVAVVRGVYAD